MAKQNLNHPSSLPAQPVDWQKVREEHGKPNNAVIDRHERILHDLDQEPASRGGRRDER